MRNYVEPLVRKMIKMNNHKINLSFPAIVVGVANISDGFIDVKPIVNHMNSLNAETTQYPVLRGVRVMYPSSKTSTICFPLVQGDTVDLLFQSVDIEDFVNGKKEQYDPYTTGYGNLANVVALVGFTPYQESCFNPNNYTNEFNNLDLNIVHNKNTDAEAIISLNTDGDVSVKSPTKVVVDAKEVELVSDTVDAHSAVIKTEGDVVIGGRSLKQFMIDYDIHAHIGNQGTPTSSPIKKV